MTTMKTTIDRLLREAKPIDNPIVKMLREEVPANATRGYLDCQLILKGGYAMAGILTYAKDTAGDVLQLVSVAKTPDGKIVLADHYFAHDEVQAVVFGRELPEQLVKPVNPTRNGSPIIIG